MNAPEGKIRPYIESDWEQVREIYDLSKPDEMRDIVNPDAITPLAEDDRMLDYFRGSEISVYVEGRDILGFIGRKGDVVSWLFVHPGQRRKGIGRRLLEYLINTHDNTFRLNLARTNHIAMALYESLGFTVYDEFEGSMYGQRIPAVRMVREYDPGDTVGTDMITDPGHVTAEWITEALRRSRCLPRGRVARFDAVRESSYTSTILRLGLTYSGEAPDSAPERLLLKLSRTGPEQRVVGREQRRREVEFHTTLVPAMDPAPVVRCHYAAFSDETGDSCLLFDDVSMTHSPGEPDTPPPLDRAESAIDSFAEFHAFWWDNQALGDIEPMPSEMSVAEHVASVYEHFPRFADALGSRLAESHRLVYDRTLGSLPGLWTRVTAGKDLTLIHGDASFANVLLPVEPTNDRALIIDWQLYGISFSAEDLSHLIPLFWKREQRRTTEKGLLERYHAGLVRSGVEGYGWDDCWHDYRLAVILRVMFMPLWFWVNGSPESTWGFHLDRAMEAFEDLDCMELLE